MQAIGYRVFSSAAAVVFAAGVQLAATAIASEPRRDPIAEQAAGLAEAASKEFSTIMERQRLAQTASKPETPAGKKQDAKKQLAPGPTPPFSWLQQSSEQFQALMEMLAGGGSKGQPRPWDPVADAEKKAAPAVAKPESGRPAAPPAAVQTAPVPRPAPAPEGDAAKAAEAKKAADAKAADAKAAEDARKAAEAKAAEDARKAAETKKLADAKAVEDARKAAEAKAAEDARKAAEAKKLADAKAAEDARKAAEARAVEDARKAAEAKKLAEAQRMADQKKAEEAKAAVDAKRADAEARKAEVEKRAKAAKPAEAERQLARPSGDQPGEVNAACPAAGASITAPGWYVVRKGDTLSQISQRHYGRAGRYPAVRAANRIHNPHKIYVCQRIYLPDLRT